MKLLIFVCFLAIVAAQEEKSSVHHLADCIRAHLESEVLSPDCDKEVKIAKKQATDFLVGNTTTDSTVKCIKETMKEYNLMNVYLRLTYQRITRGSNLGRHTQAIVIRDALQRLCNHANEFEKILALDLEDIEALKAVHVMIHDDHSSCLYKYLIEKKFLSQTDFDIPSLSLRPLDCEDYMKAFDDEVKEAPQESRFPSKYSECLTRKYKDFFLLKDRKLVVLRVIGFFVFSDTQKEKYKVMFKRWHFAEDRFFLECAVYEHERFEF